MLGPQTFSLLRAAWRALGPEGSSFGLQELSPQASGTTHPDLSPATLPRACVPTPTPHPLLTRLPANGQRPAVPSPAQVLLNILERYPRVAYKMRADVLVKISGYAAVFRRWQLAKHFGEAPSACAPPLGASHFLQKVPRQSGSKLSWHGRCATPLPPQLRPNPASPAPYAAQLAVVAHHSWLATPRGSSPPSLTRPPPANRLAPATPPPRPLCCSTEQSRATPRPCATFPAPTTTIITRPPPNGHSRRSSSQNSAKIFGHLYIIDLYIQLFAHTCIVTQIYDLVACVRLAYPGRCIRK